LPFVWKSTRFGYDGKGVKVIRKVADLDNLPEIACIAESLVDIDKELAVIAARNASGEIRCFPACEMVFHGDANLVEQVFCPSAVAPALLKRAEDLAKGLIEALGICGLLAVEFFVTVGGELLVNEVAPRPHNSGHFTIEACFTSQYEQHLRGILDLPLGDPGLKCPAVMVNLIGEPGFSGPVFYAGADAVLASAGAYLHIYGKRETRPYRKMGHITVVRPTLEAAQSIADQLQKTLIVISK
jgi:5-(carboxyamino)imidazole ribonucleotide synthase